LLFLPPKKLNFGTFYSHPTLELNSVCFLDAFRFYFIFLNKKRTSSRLYVDLKKLQVPIFQA